ncbi:DUF6463 family protein [Kribbella amoyensis]|nr:DUF6463 family protein [Kribbella amoyensis]
MSVAAAIQAPPRLTRRVPVLTSGLGVVHLVYAVAESPDVLRAMAADGILAAANDYQRDYVTWFVVAGFTLLMTGSILRWTVRRTGQVPPSAGWWLLGTGIFAVILEPTGGAWALVLLGALTAYASRQEVRNPASSEPRR